jgi:hypothetical protein
MLVSHTLSPTSKDPANLEEKLRMTVVADSASYLHWSE